MNNGFPWSASTIGSVTAAIAIIVNIPHLITFDIIKISLTPISQYFLYMLYFDWLSHHHFGSVRQQIWAFLHFPFHLALVLATEGGAQFVFWRKIVEILGMVDNMVITSIDNLTTGSTAADVASKLNETTQLVFSYYPPKAYSNTINEADDAIKAIGAATDDDSLITAVSSLAATIQNSLFATYGIDPPENNNPTAISSLDEASSYDKVFVLVVSIPAFPQPR